MSKILWTVGVVWFLGTQADAQTLDASLDNGVIKVGVSRLYGGAIAWLSEKNGSNLVNNADKGRQIQQSYYAGNSVTSTNQCPAWSPWPWNPILAGDCGNSPSPVLTLASSGGQLYVKTQPRLWDRSVSSLAQAYLEQWVCFHPSLSNVVVVDSKLTCFRDSNDEWGVAGARDQELPACYFVACLSTIQSYTNNAPWQDGALVTIPNTPASGTFPWVRFTPTEKWSACVNSSGRGVGVYTPIATASLAGKSGTSTSCSTSSGSTMYVSPLGQYALGRTSTFSYRYYLVVGLLAEIRAAVYALHSAAPVLTGLTALPGNGQVKLAWNATADASTYNLKVSTLSGPPYTTLATGLTAASYTSAALTNGTTYSYVVSSVNALGESSNSAPVSATPACNSPVDVPNYSFEAPYLGTGSAAFQYNPKGGSWAFSGGGLSGNGSAFTSGNPLAPQGQQVAFLQQGGSFSQALSGFNPGQAYTVTFAAEQRANLVQAGQTWNVSVNGVVIGNFAPPQTATNYLDYVATFKATSTNQTLAFVGTNLKGGDNTVFIDHVRVVEVPTLPEITNQPSSQSVFAGSSASFGVAVRGTGLNYQWRRSGSNIFGATASTYTIDAVGKGESGDYDVAVSNTCGTTYSATARLTVNNIPMIASPAWSGELFEFEVLGSSGLRYTVFCTTNLREWKSLLITNPASERFLFADPVPTNSGQRFYRVLVQP